MAKLEVKGPYEGPGEQKTAERLAAELPDDWRIYAGRKLAGANRDDVDLIVVGRHGIFVIDEKSWGPRVVVDDSNWYVNDVARPNPLNRTAQLARKLAGLLRKHAHGYRHLKGKLVVPCIVLSHDDLQIFSGSHHDHSERIYPLAEASRSLVGVDNDLSPGIRSARESVLGYVSDMPAQGKRPTELGGYVISGLAQSTGTEMAYEAEAPDGSHVILKCYNTDSLSDRGDPSIFLERETKALNVLADTGRTWSSYPYFSADAHKLFVVPLVPPNDGRNLITSLKRNDPERPEGRLDDETALKVVSDAFKALAEVHELGLVHRALHPSRIWLGRGMRVRFSDFHLARISGEQSIALWAPDEDVSDAYRGPECAADIRLAEPASDVYALSLSLIHWLTGNTPEDFTISELSDELKLQWPFLADTLTASLAASGEERPAASECWESLSNQQSRSTETKAAPESATSTGEFVAQGLIEGRYKLEKLLGRGGFASSWLAYDERSQEKRVLKEYHRDISEAVKREYDVAHSLKNDFCGQVYDIQRDSSPPYLVCEYIDGDNLESLDGNPDEGILRVIAMNILEALTYIHERDLIHGDVTPSNIIVRSPQNTAVLIDFGLSVAAGDQPYGGHPKFMAPEVRDGRLATSLSDIYGLCASLLHTMLGKVPSSAGDGAEFRDYVTAAEIEQWGSSGVALLRVLLKGIARTPNARPSATEMMSLVQAATGNETVSSGEPKINSTVDSIRRLYRASRLGNAGNRGLDDDFAKETYIPTLLDTDLMPRIASGEFDVVLLTGNPGDGKTSFLVSVGDHLKSLGASITHADEAGWIMQLGDREFRSVFDASESHGERSSDDLLQAALGPAVSQSPGSTTALVAVNDGRLFQFFNENDEFDDLGIEVRNQALTGEVSNPRVALVDLKQRSLASFPGEQSLAARVLASLTDESKWQTCSSCSARSNCPILRNRNILSEGGESAFSDLVLTSHLRRRRRATFRDVRSAAAWVISGDKGCSDIHQGIQDGRNPLLLPSSSAYDLAFSDRSEDYLVREWTDFDPGKTSAPLLDAARRANREGHQVDPTLISASAMARSLFFGTWGSEEAQREQVLAYRYLPEFIEMLRSPDPDQIIDRILLGISRSLGAPGFFGKGLAVNSGSADSEWTVLHIMPAKEFAIDVSRKRSRFIEQIPDELFLKHKLGPTLGLTLDTVEIVLRAADGEIVNDGGADSILQEIEGFVGQLRRYPASTAHVVDPSGVVSRMKISDQQIIMEMS